MDDVGADADPTVLIADSALTYIRVDHQTRLQFGDAEVVIETPFTLTAAGVEHRLDPEARSGLGPLLAVYPNDLVAATARPDCSLVLDFVSGARIVIDQHPSYEAWSIVGPGSRLVVCPPAGAGTLSVWR